jgi:hypothetical protein
VRAAGINVKSGLVHVAVVEPAAELLGSPVSGIRCRIAPGEGLQGAERLDDLKIRIRQELQTGRVETIGLVETRAHGGWTYRQAYDRITAICAVMAASTEIRAAYAALKTSEIGGLVGVAADHLEQVAFERFGFESPPKYWTTGLAEAYAAAAAALAAALARAAK